MALVILIDVVLLIGLVYLTVSKGLEAALPFFRLRHPSSSRGISHTLRGLFAEPSDLRSWWLIVLLVFARRGPGRTRNG